MKQRHIWGNMSAVQHNIFGKSMIKELKGMNITRCYIQSEATLTFMAAAGAPAFV